MELHSYEIILYCTWMEMDVSGANVPTMPCPTRSKKRFSEGTYALNPPHPNPTPHPSRIFQCRSYIAKRHDSVEARMLPTNPPNPSFVVVETLGCLIRLFWLLNRGCWICRFAWWIRRFALWTLVVESGRLWNPGLFLIDLLYMSRDVWLKVRVFSPTGTDRRHIHV